MDGLALTGSLADERAARVEARLSQSAFLAAPLRTARLRQRRSLGLEQLQADGARLRRGAAPGRPPRRDGPVRLLEIGGGRGPQFTPDEAEKLGVALTVNDIDARELSLAPQGFATACFNIAGDVDPVASRTSSISYSRAWCSSM